MFEANPYPPELLLYSVANDCELEFAIVLAVNAVPVDDVPENSSEALPPLKP